MEQNSAIKFRRQRLLIVENEEEQQQFYRLHLADSYELLWALNAAEALTRAFHARPDLILLNVNIPSSASANGDEGGGKDVTGLDVCRQLKSSALRHTPILLISKSDVVSKNDVILRVRERFVHADEYLKKPITLGELKMYIQKYLGNPKAQTRLSNYNAQPVPFEELLKPEIFEDTVEEKKILGEFADPGIFDDLEYRRLL